MTSDRSSRLLRVIYQDDRLTQDAPGPIVVSPGVINATLDLLGTAYLDQTISGSSGQAYLINGVLVQPFSIANPPLHDSKNGIDAISLIGESRTGIELLASSLRLPEIEEYNFLRRVV